MREIPTARGHDGRLCQKLATGSEASLTLLVKQAKVDRL